MVTHQTTEEQKKVVDALKEAFGFQRIILVGLDSAYENVRIVWSNCDNDFVPSILKKQGEHLVSPQKLSVVPN